MPSLQELRDQQNMINAQIAAAETEERERKAREAEQAREAQQAERRRLLEHRKTGITRGIASAIMAAQPGSTVTFSELIDYPRFSIDGQDERFSVRYDEKREKENSWSTRKSGTGRYYVIVETSQFDTMRRHGMRGRRSREAIKRFPPRKDGTHAYEAIAQWLLHCHNTQKRAAAQAHVEKINATRSRTLVEQIADKHGRKLGVVIDSCTLDSDKVRFSFNKDLTLEQTDALIQALIQLGLTS